MKFAADNNENMSNNFPMQATTMIEDANAAGALSPNYPGRAVFAKYTKSSTQLQGIYTAAGEDRFMPQTPVTPSMVISPRIVENMPSVKSELLTPDSFQDSLSPEELLGFEDPSLFDELDLGQVNEWESLFLNDTLNCPEDVATRVVVEPKHELGEQTPAAVQPAVPAEILSPVSTMSPANVVGLDSPLMASASRTAVGGISKSSPRGESRESRVDDLGITMYKRKPRATPLKPVEIPEDADTVVAKRAKNTEAARRSRARKLERMSQLEERVRALLDENEQLRAEINRLKNSNKTSSTE